MVWDMHTHDGGSRGMLPSKIFTNAEMQSRGILG